MQPWTFLPGRITSMSYILILSWWLLDFTRKLSMPNEKLYEGQKYALHESMVILLHFDGTNSVCVQSLA